MLKHGISISTQFDIEETSLSKFSLVTVTVQHFDIVIYRYRRFLDFDKCSFNICIRYRSFSPFDIEFRVLRYRCLFVGSSLGCLLGTGHRLQCAHCVANQSLPVAHAPPGPPSAAAAEAALGGAAAPAAPGASPAAAAGAGLGRRSGHQRNAGARDSWRQKLTGTKFAAAGAAAAAAGAGIEGTQERVIPSLGDKN
jgi:hypothetical protein